MSRHVLDMRRVIRDYYSDSEQGEGEEPASDDSSSRPTSKSEEDGVSPEPVLV